MMSSDDVNTPIAAGETDKSEASPNPAKAVLVYDDVLEDERVANAKSSAGIEYSPITFFLLFVGLALAVFLAALDQTILAVAIAPIVTDFQTFSGLSWIFTAYLLTATAFIPTYGKMADVFGRKAVILVAIVIFEIGSAICGASVNMTMLIIGRAVAGLGGGGIFSLVIVIISDIVAIEKRAMYQGIIGAVFGLASVAGPLMGGAFTANVTWRWCFYINLPIGALTVVAVVFFLKLPVGSGDIAKQLRRIDYLGTFLLILGIVFMLVPLSEGGNDYPWNSGFVIGFLVAGVVVLALFTYVELRIAVEPVIPMSLFRNRHVAAIFWIALFTGMTFFPFMSYTSTFFEVVNGDAPVQAGIDSLPLILSLVVFSIVAGGIITATGRYQPLLVAGAILEIVGGGLMFTLTEHSSTGQKVGYLLILGAGLGISWQSTIIGGQAAASADLLALVTANTNFWFQIGAVLGVAISSSIFSNKLTASLAVLAPGASAEYVKNSPSALRTAPAEMIPHDQLDGVIASYVNGLSYIFVLAIPFAALALLGTFFVKRSRIPKGTEIAVAGA